METLVQLPGVELWEVHDSARRLLQKGEWCITTQNGVTTSRVGNISWQLESRLHCLKASSQSYVFAINPEISYFYCLNLPADVAADDLVVLETTLESFTTLEVAIEPVPSRTDKFVVGLGNATTSAVAGLSIAAHYIGDAVLRGAERYRQRSEPCKEPRQISETTKQRVQRVKDAAKMAAGVTGAAVEAVSVFTSKAADSIIGNGASSDPQKPASKAKRVAAAVVVSAAEIYDGMVEAAVIVSKKTADATKNVVSHKFGAEAGELSGDGLAAAGHSANAFVQSTRLGTKAILKSTAKKTAIGYMQGGSTNVTGTN